MDVRRSLSSVFRDIDTNQDGLVDFTEFERWWSSGTSRSSKLFQRRFDEVFKAAQIKGERIWVAADAASSTDDGSERENDARDDGDRDAVPPYMAALLDDKLAELGWKDTLNRMHLSPLTLAAKRGNRRFFAHLTKQRSVLFQQFAHVTQYLFPLDGVDLAHSYMLLAHAFNRSRNHSFGQRHGEAISEGSSAGSKEQQQQQQHHHLGWPGGERRGSMRHRLRLAVRPRASRVEARLPMRSMVATKCITTEAGAATWIAT